MKRIDGTRTFAAGLFLFLVPLTAAGTGDEGLGSGRSDVGENDPAVSADSDADNESRSDPPSYLLRYRFRKGEVIRYRSESIEEQCFSVAGRSKTDRTQVQQVRRFEVSGLDPSGQASLVMQFESVEMSKQVDDQEPIVFRSSMKPSEVPPMYAAFADRLRSGAPRFVVAPTGTPTNEDDEIIVRPDTDEQHEKHKDQPDTRLRPPVPKHPVKVGDSWKYISRVKVRVAEDITREIGLLTTCRLESIESGIARIKFTTSPTIRLKSIAARSQLASAQPRGYSLMDIEAGRITKRVTRNSNTVHGVRGPQSLLTYSSETIEELLTEAASVSQR